MKGIKDWANDMENNEEVYKKFEGLENVGEIIKLAKEEGYEFTEDDFMDLQMEMVSGGGVNWGKVGNFMKKYVLKPTVMAAGGYLIANGGAKKIAGKAAEAFGNFLG